jgi:hypothetical protein
MAEFSLITRLSDWPSISSPLAPITIDQLDCVSELGKMVTQRACLRQ